MKTTAQKGNFGETLGDAQMAAEGFERLGPDRVTSIDHAGHHGIDGIYYKAGDPPEYRIIDQKYATDGSFSLSRTVSGVREMSPQWIQQRLDDYFGAGGRLTDVDRAHLHTLTEQFDAVARGAPAPDRVQVSTRVQAVDGTWAVKDVSLAPKVDPVTGGTIIGDVSRESPVHVTSTGGS